SITRSRTSRSRSAKRCEKRSATSAASAATASCCRWTKPTPRSPSISAAGRISSSRACSRASTSAGCRRSSCRISSGRSRSRSVRTCTCACAARTRTTWSRRPSKGSRVRCVRRSREPATCCRRRRGSYEHDSVARGRQRARGPLRSGRHRQLRVEPRVARVCVRTARGRRAGHGRSGPGSRGEPRDPARRRRGRRRHGALAPRGARGGRADADPARARHLPRHADPVQRVARGGHAVPRGHSRHRETLPPLRRASGPAYGLEQGRASWPLAADGRPRRRRLRVLSAQLCGAGRRVHARDVRVRHRVLGNRRARQFLRRAVSSRALVAARGAAARELSRTVMKLIPAIDIRGGRCVRLLQGDFAKETRYDADPVELAAQYRALGAEWLHVVDLVGAAAGAPANLPLVKAMRADGLKVQLGGGIRDDASLEQALAIADRIVIGSLAVTAPERVAGWLGAYGAARFTLGFDVRIDAAGTAFITTHGWTQTSTLTLGDAIERFLPQGLTHVLCTDVARDGALAGPNLD